MFRDPIVEFLDFNRPFRGRYRRALEFKVRRMAASPFGFLRGSFHLFARDIEAGVLEFPGSTLETPIVGDLHAENFGTFKSADGTIHFDINDFDETTTGPFDLDLKRLAASWCLVAEERRLSLPESALIATRCAEGYVETILGGPVRPPGPVKKLIHKAERAQRSKYIKAVTVRRRLRRSPMIFDLRPTHLAQARHLLADYARRRPDLKKRGPGFFDALDIAGRIAGCGSLGRLRFVVLLRGDKESVILEFKEALPSALDQARRKRVGLRDRAAQVITMERSMQRASNRLLGWGVDGGMSFQVRELGPRNLRLQPEDMKDGELGDIARYYGSLAAQAQGNAGKGCRVRIASVLRHREGNFIRGIAAFALAYSSIVEEDHRRLAANTAIVRKKLLK